MKSIRSKLVLYFYTTMVLILIALAYFAFMVTSNVFLDREVKNMEIEASKVSRIFELYLDNEIKKLEIIARNNVIMSQSTIIDEKISALLEEQYAGEYEVMDYITVEGEAYLTNKSVINISDREYFQQVMKGKPAISDLLTSRQDGSLVYIFAVPVIRDNLIIGAIVGVKDVTGMCDYLTKSDVYRNAKEFVIDGNGRIIASTNEVDVLYSKSINEYIQESHFEELISSDNIDKSGSVVLFEQESFVVTEAIQGTNWYVLLSVPRAEVMSLLNIPRFVYIVGSIFAMIVAYFVIVHIGKRITKPILALTEDVETIKDNMFDGKVLEELQEEPSEVGVLARTINELIELKQKSYEEIQNQKKEILEHQRELLLTLGSVLEAKSQETGAHVERVSTMSYHLACLIGMDEEEAQVIGTNSALHDVGKIGVPDAILNKPGKLTSEEYEIVKKHTEYGVEILSKSKTHSIQIAREIILYHHERWDGKGYPKGLREKEIPLNARLVAIADVFDSLASVRCYKNSWDYASIKEYFREQSGKQFDPFLTSVLLKNFNQFVEIRENIEEMTVNVSGYEE